jgi:hypothetical protein
VVAVPRPREPESATRPWLTERRQAEVIHDVLTAGWQATVADQLATALNDELWQAPRRRSATVDCRALAELAEQVEAVKKSAHDAVGKVVARATKALGRSSMEEEILAAFARTVPLPGDEQADAVVHGLRVTGVFVCLVGDTDILRDCPCFRALAKDHTEEELTETLEQKLDELVTEYRTRLQRRGTSQGDSTS